MTTLLLGRILQSECGLIQPSRSLGRRMPKQGKPPILPPSKKVLYRVVHVPWQKPEEVKELLWRRMTYNSAATSLRNIFQAELQEKANAGQGIESMREAEEAELDQLIEENQKINLKKAVDRTERDKEEWKATKLEILEEIEESLRKQRELAAEATEEVRAAIERSVNFVNKDNLEAKILAALENPTVYDFAIDKLGHKYMDPTPVKYQEGIPTRQKGRLYDKTLGLPENMPSLSATA